MLFYCIYLCDFWAGSCRCKANSHVWPWCWWNSYLDTGEGVCCVFWGLWSSSGRCAGFEEETWRIWGQLVFQNLPVCSHSPSRVCACVCSCVFGHEAIHASMLSCRAFCISCLLLEQAMALNRELTVFKISFFSPFFPAWYCCLGGESSHSGQGMQTFGQWLPRGIRPSCKQARGAYHPMAAADWIDGQSQIPSRRIRGAAPLPEHFQRFEVSCLLPYAMQICEHITQEIVGKAQQWRRYVLFVLTLLLPRFTMCCTVCGA